MLSSQSASASDDLSSSASSSSSSSSSSSGSFSSSDSVEVGCCLDVLPGEDGTVVGQQVVDVCTVLGGITCTCTWEWNGTVWVLVDSECS